MKLTGQVYVGIHIRNCAAQTVVARVEHFINYVKSLYQDCEQRVGRFREAERRRKKAE